MGLTKKEKVIINHMEKLDITREEAEELWAFDNGETENEVVDAIEEKQQAKQQKKEQRSSLEKVKYMQAKAKGDANKEVIIDDITSRAAASEHIFHCQHMTATKMSFVDKDGFFYTVQVTKHKSRPDGYTADLRAQEE